MKWLVLQSSPYFSLAYVIESTREYFHGGHDQYFGDSYTSFIFSPSLLAFKWWTRERERERKKERERERERDMETGYFFHPESSATAAMSSSVVGSVICSPLVPRINFPWNTSYSSNTLACKVEGRATREGEKEKEREKERERDSGREIVSFKSILPFATSVGGLFLVRPLFSHWNFPFSLFYQNVINYVIGAYSIG